jgi:hypothetical protein
MWLSTRRLRLGLLALGGVGVLVLVVYALPPVLVGPEEDLTTAERLKAENDVRTTLLQALAGAILLSGLYFTGRTYILNREGQVTERFTRAIDQLGSKESLDVRLGGIYGLERIAQESERDHWTVIEVLTAFVRERARRPEPEDEEDPDAWRLESRPPEADVQAALNVLGRRNRKHESDDQRLHLPKTDLRYADLRRVHFEGANLFQAHLGGALLHWAHLEDANLFEADLQGTDFGEAHLEGANLSGAHLGGAQTDGTHLEGADFGEAHLEGADLREALGLTTEQLVYVFVDERTKLPPELDVD